MDLATIVFLVVLLAWQQWFWMQHTQELVNKLMSRSFPEYQQATKKPVAKVDPKPALPDIPQWASEQADEANRVMGITR